MLSGVIVLYKTKGMTSTDCVRDMRRVLQMKKSRPWWDFGPISGRNLAHCDWTSN